MNKRKEYQRRAELAREIVEGNAYRSYPLWGVDYTETIRNIQRRNCKRLRESNDYLPVEGCDNRCIIRRVRDASETIYTLESYDTDVCYIACTWDGWYFVRQWDGWTPTTMKHVNAFRKQFGFQPMTKYVWLMLDGPEYR